MASVHSATGPVGPPAGVCLPHEHTFINLEPTLGPDGHMTVWDERVDDFRRFKAAGGEMVWDVTNGELSNHAAPVYFDRDPVRLAQDRRTGSRSVANVLATRALAEQTEVSIILGTGHYFEAYLDPAWWDSTPTNTIADFLIADLVDGFPGTDIRAGFLGEIGSNNPVITAREERSFRAAGRAAAVTGALVSTHAPTYPTGLAQIEILVSEGVDPERIVIGHTDTVKDIGYHRDLLNTGVYIQYDCMMSCKVGGEIVEIELDRRIDYLKQLTDDGHVSKILLSHDVCQRSHQASHGGPGLTFLLEEFWDAAIAYGISDEDLRMMTVDNPRRAMFGV